MLFRFMVTNWKPIELLLPKNMHACMHTYIHKYTHICIDAYIHTCTHTYTHITVDQLFSNNYTRNPLRSE